MEIKGNKKELESFFLKERKRKKINFKNQFEKISKKQKTFMLVGLFITLLVLVNYVVITALYSKSTKYITKTECDEKINEEIAKSISLNKQYGIFSIFFIYSQFTKMIIIFILISWILHGVGFRII